MDGEPIAAEGGRAEQRRPWCPRCNQLTGDAEQCPKCGLPQRGADVDRLREIAVRLHDIWRQQSALATEIQHLRQEQVQLFGRVGGRPAFTRAQARAAHQPFEWRWELVRDLVLWLGAALVGTAALIFAAVTWARLTDVQRALLLLAATLVAGGAAGFTRRRLPATAQALSGLTAVLVLVDWYVVRRAGVAEAWSDGTWWALGTGLSAAGAAAASRWFSVQRLFVAVLAQVAIVLALAEGAGGAGPVGAGFALAASVTAGVAATLASDRAWRFAVPVLFAGAGVMLLVAALAAGSLLPPADLFAALTPAAVIASMALAPAAVRWRLAPPPSRPFQDGLVAASGAALVAAGATLTGAVWDGDGGFGPVAVLGLVAFAAGRLGPEPLRQGTQITGVSTVGIGVLGVAEAVSRALGGPLSWAGDPWAATLELDAAEHLTPPPVTPADGYGAALVALLALGAAAAVARAPLRGASIVRAPLPVVAGAVAVTGIVGVVPLAAGGPIWAACTLIGAVGAAALVTSAGVDRRREPAPAAAQAAALAAAGGALAATATGWALATEAGTLVWIASLAGAAGVAAAVARRDALRLGFAALAAAAVLGEVAAVAAGAGADVAACGFALAVAGGALVAAGAHSWHRASQARAVEVAGGLGLLVGAAVAATAEPWLALSLTLAAAWLALAGIAPARRAYLWTAGWVAVMATWAWLGQADVTVVEAYTLPAAAAALASGAAARRRSPQLSSWAAWAPGLLVALLPTLDRALGEPGIVRPVAVTAGGLVVVAAGARAQQQAPLVLGAVTLLVMAVDALAPVATELPRWLTIGTAGLLLLWLGATAERRVAELTRLRRRLEEMEPESWSPFLRRPAEGKEGGTA